MADNRCDHKTYSREVLTAGLNRLDEKAAGGGVPVDSADEVLHGRLVGQADQVLDVVHNEPRQVLGVVQVLTLRKTMARAHRPAGPQERTSEPRAGPEGWRGAKFRAPALAEDGCRLPPLIHRQGSPDRARRLHPHTGCDRCKGHPAGSGTQQSSPKGHQTMAGGRRVWPRAVGEPSGTCRS